MNIYLAGPMRGIPYFNYPAFDAYAKLLRGWGHDVFSPVESDKAYYGADMFLSNSTGDMEQAVRDHDFDLRVALRLDLEYICDFADCVALIPDWWNSKGARAEWATAQALGIPTIYLGELPCDDAKAALEALASTMTTANTGAAA